MILFVLFFFFFFFNDTATTEIYTLSLHDALPIYIKWITNINAKRNPSYWKFRSEEHTSELQSRVDISYAVFCLKKKKTNKHTNTTICPSNNFAQPTIPQHS